jgi:glutamate-5-semialdehyde dehydrogenase
MTVVSETPAVDFAQQAAALGGQARRAARALATTPGRLRDHWLHAVAGLLRERVSEFVAANKVDLLAAPGLGLNAASIDRLRLDAQGVEKLAQAVEAIARQTDPIGEVIEGQVRPNGLDVRKVRVPLGVVLFIYESRPGVTVDAAALCVKSGNAVILRGGKEAIHSNRALHRLLADAAGAVGLPEHGVQLVDTTDRAMVGELLKLSKSIDVTIPRGGRSLIERVAREATMPVIKHFDGVCHVFVDKAADPVKAREILVNAKCQRPAVCNAAETLLIHSEVAETLLPDLGGALLANKVELRGCPRTRDLVPAARPATDEDYHTEYGDLILSVKVVEDLDAALAHIEEYGSHHTDAIVTEDLAAARRFVAGVDSAAVMVNASTRFNDGGELGLGAEIGISTDKFHARGPCGARELTSYKWVVQGDGQIRT